MIDTNPFSVTTPEDMPAEAVVDLFVDVFSDFPKIPIIGHTFLHGPRGSGKSMMFRYLQPDCQKLAHNCSLHQLPFCGFYVSVKNTELKLTELCRLDESHGSPILNEHFLVSFLFKIVMKYLLEFTQKAENAGKQLKELAEDCILNRLLDSGAEIDKLRTNKSKTASSVVYSLNQISDKIYMKFLNYIRNLAFNPNPSYRGPILGYLDFLFPVLCDIQSLPFMPKGPAFLLIDDADNLNLTQTKILNSWVASRTSSKVSIKISTQLQYKTYRTVSGHQIESPHDFSEINISTVYTSNKNKYLERLSEIISRRLRLHQITSNAEQFFPPDKEQETKIAQIAAKYRANWKLHGKGYRPSDDANRYARPDFFKSLAGTKKSSYNYSYSGFEQLAHLSSGIIRHFLDAAARMYGEVSASKKSNTLITHIPPNIQDNVVRKIADDVIITEFAKLSQDQSESAPNKQNVQLLYNLVRGLGGMFRCILLSDRSERRVFSIALSNQVSENVDAVLRLGMQLGYFYKSTIGNKEGTGRTPLYVFTRRLAPYFNLDPTSFAGYLFITGDQLWAMMQNPEAYVRRLRNGRSDQDLEAYQLSIFDQEEE